jgi:integrase
MDGYGKRRRRSKTFPTRTEARKWLNACLAEVGAGRVYDSGALTMGEYLDDWLGSLGIQQLEAATVSWYKSAVERHIVPALGHIRLSRLTGTSIEAFLADKAAHGRLDGKGGLGPSSVRRLRVTLHKAMDAAVRHGLIPSNPVDLADTVRVPAKDVTETTWTPDVLETFLEATRTEREHPIWHVAGWTGLRRSELCALQWGDIDGDVISIRRARVEVDGRVVVKGPKSAKSRRTVDLDGDTVAVLSAWRKRQLEERLLAGSGWESGDWVFTDRVGRPWYPSQLTKVFTRRVTALGLPATDVKGLRHAHATALLASGTHPEVVRERLGHSSISVTIDIYSSVVPGMQRDAVERLAETMKRSR